MTVGSLILSYESDVILLDELIKVTITILDQLGESPIINKKEITIHNQILRSDQTKKHIYNTFINQLKSLS